MATKAQVILPDDAEDGTVTAGESPADQEIGAETASTPHPKATDGRTIPFESPPPAPEPEDLGGNFWSVRIRNKPSDFRFLIFRHEPGGVLLELGQLPSASFSDPHPYLAHAHGPGLYSVKAVWVKGNSQEQRAGKSQGELTVYLPEQPGQAAANRAEASQAFNPLNPVLARLTEVIERQDRRLQALEESTGRQPSLKGILEEHALLQRAVGGAVDTRSEPTFKSQAKDMVETMETMKGLANNFGPQSDLGSAVELIRALSPLALPFIMRWAQKGQEAPKPVAATQAVAQPAPTAVSAPSDDPPIGSPLLPGEM